MVDSWHEIPNISTFTHGFDRRLTAKGAETLPALIRHAPFETTRFRSRGYLCKGERHAHTEESLPLHTVMKVGCFLVKWEKAETSSLDLLRWE